MVSAPGPGRRRRGAARRAPRGRPWDRRRGRRGRRMPCLGGGRRLVWDRSDVVARCDGGREGGTGDQFGGREGGSGGAARDEGAGAGRRESGAASGGARGDVGGAIGSSRAPTRSGFFPRRAGPTRGALPRGGGARSIAARSRSRARAPGRIPPRDDPSDRLDDADERVRGGSGRPRPSRARAPAPGRRSGGPAPRHDPPPSRKRRKKRAGRLRETVARGRRDASRATSEARVNLACVSARRSRRWAGSCAERDAGSGARDRPRHHPFANLLTRGTSPRARRARAPAGAPKNARTNSLQNWNF